MSVAPLDSLARWSSAVSVHARRRWLSLRRADDGGIAVLGVGLCLCLCLLVLGGICVHSAQVARVDVLDAADHAGAAAADRIAAQALYTSGVDHPRLDPSDVAAEAASVLATTTRPAHVASWRVASSSVDGDQLTLRIVAVVDPPAVGGALSALGAPITVTVESRAHAHLER